MPTRLPAEPLKEELRRRLRLPGTSCELLAQRLGVSARTLHRLMAAGEVTSTLADRYALRLGTHPRVLWADLWDPEDES